MKNYLLYFIAIFSLSQSANIVRLAQAPIEVLGFWRLLISAAIVVTISIWRGPFFQHLKAQPKAFWYSVISGIFFFLHLWTFFYASKNTTIANCMIIYSTNPLFVAVGAYFFFQEKMNWRLAIAYLLAFAGIYQLMSHNLKFDQGMVAGDFSALISAIFFTVYLLTGKKVRSHFANTEYSSIIYFVASLCFGLFGLSQGIQFTNYGLQTWLSIGASIILPTLLGHALFTYLMKFMNVNLMTCGKLIEPAISSAIAFLLFHEELKSNTLLAFLLTSIAVLFLFLPMPVNKEVQSSDEN